MHLQQPNIDYNNRLVNRLVMEVGMRTIGAFEAKTHFSKLLAEVCEGEKIYITKRGKTVAVLAPVVEESSLSVDEVLSRIKALRAESKVKLTLADVEKLKNAGRK